MLRTAPAEEHGDTQGHRVGHRLPPNERMAPLEYMTKGEMGVYGCGVSTATRS